MGRKSVKYRSEGVGADTSQKVSKNLPKIEIRPKSGHPFTCASHNAQAKHMYVARARDRPHKAFGWRTIFLFSLRLKPLMRGKKEKK